MVLDLDAVEENIDWLHSLLPPQPTRADGAFARFLQRDLPPLPAEYYRNYNPDQPRDEDGKWSAGGDTGGSSTHIGSPGMTKLLPEKLQGAIGAKLAALGISSDQIAQHMDDVFTGPNIDMKQKDWYRTAHNDAAKIADEHGYHHETAFAITAVLSPSLKWTTNTKVAETIMRRVHENQPFVVSETALRDYASNAKNAADIKEHPLPGPGSYRFTDFASPKQAVVLGGLPLAQKAGFGPTQQAYEIARANPDKVGNVVSGPKVRSFYNNIANPEDPRSVTVDTWMYRAGADAQPLNIKSGGTEGRMTLRQWWDDQFINKGKKPQVQTIFQTSPSMVGVPKMGLYSVFADAIRTNAAKHNLLPNEYQAIVWEAVKNHSEWT